MEFAVWNEEEALQLKDSQLKATCSLNGMTQRLELENLECRYDEQTGRYLATASVKELDEAVRDGTPVQVESVRTSQQ